MIVVITCTTQRMADYSQLHEYTESSHARKIKEIITGSTDKPIKLLFRLIAVGLTVKLTLKDLRKQAEAVDYF
jgi:hypothetical protein